MITLNIIVPILIISVVIFLLIIWVLVAVYYGMKSWFRKELSPSR